jgi:hypothetical protein
VSAARVLIRCWHTLVVAILVLSLHAPTLQDLLSLTTEAACGASCSRSGKDCSCCHHAGKQRIPLSARWSSGDACPKDCGQFAELPTQPGVAASDIACLEKPNIRFTPLTGRFHTGRSCVLLDAALFQRPPPVLL